MKKNWISLGEIILRRNNALYCVRRKEKRERTNDNGRGNEKNEEIMNY